jgi:phosphatidyl-myo-inositol dimannoside synthase
MNHAESTHTLYLITHEFYPKRGGIATFTAEMAKASVDLGLDVEVWAQKTTDLTEKSWPFRLKRLPLKGTHDLSCQLRLAFQLIKSRRKLRNATVYLPEPGPMLTLMLLQQFHAFLPKRLILTFHGSEILKFYRNPLIRPLARRLIAYAKRISVLTHYTRDLLISHFPEADGKILVTPGALRSDFAVVTHRPARNTNKTIVLTVGRIHPRKGQLITLAALRALAPKFRAQIEYWVVGTSNKPSYEKSLSALANTCDFPVRFFGDLPDDELSDVYDRADVFAMTSVDYGSSVEGFGLVYLEAAAHRLPVVAHAVGGVAEAIVDEVTGLLVPPDHPAQLTAAFEKLVSNESLRRQLGEAGREWAQRTTWGQSARVLFGENSSKPAPAHH